MKRVQKREKGITLIALVITIVILMILAGVSINLVIGENGIIKKAKDAAEATEQAAIREQEEMNSLYEELAGQLGGGSGGAEEVEKIVDTVKIPVGFYYVGGTKASGLVISDNSADENLYEGQTTVGTNLEGNQYVWIEVPKTAAVYPTAGLEITNFTEEEYTKIENDLHTYTSTYRNGTSYTDTYRADSTTGWFTGSDQYNEAKHNMLKSVYEKGGFYVGRYETGIETTGSPRTASGATTQTPVIKANAYPYNWVTRTQAKVLAENMEHGNRTSSLMFGVQWDLVLAFMHNRGGVADSVLTSDSKTIGNYTNNIWNITNTSAKWSGDYGDTWNNCPKNKGENASGSSNPSASILLTTGADASFGITNIYDIAGNVWEWTLEYTSSTSRPCARRGGSYGSDGSSYPASYRVNNLTSHSSDSYGFRLSLY